MTSYPETLDWLFHQLPFYQRQGKSAFKKDLTNSKRLSAHLNHPESVFKSIHVAGTNGKGSVCHMLASIFQEAGYKTGLYTSPHLKDFRERIRINGKMVSQQYVVDFIHHHKSFFEQNHLSFFEMTVGLAFQYFAEENVDIALIETGLGGRLDSTNIITPQISVITNIGFDHTKILGNTLPKIAFEKAGIIKPNIPVVIGDKQKETQPVFEQKAKETASSLYFAEDCTYPVYECALKGHYQRQNIQTVLRTVDILQKSGWTISEKAILNGLKHVKRNTRLQGRWQQLGDQPKVMCDTGHNKEGLTYVLKQLKQENYNTLHIVLGVVNDKDLEGILPLFPKEAVYYFCKPNVPRGLSAEVLAETALKFNLNGQVFASVHSALHAAKTAAKDEDLIFIGGSTFTVAEVL